MKCKRLWAMALLCPFLFETAQAPSPSLWMADCAAVSLAPWEAASRPAPLDEAFLPGECVPQGNGTLAAEPLAAQGTTAPAPETLAAQSALVMDADTGEVLYDKAGDVQRAPASTTKIMTLWLAVEHGGFSQMVTVPDSAGTAPSDSTRVPVYPGEQMPFEDLLYGLMIKSGNDAANAIGTLVSGSVAQFVEEMNQRAQQLEIQNTHFVNTHGYPAQGHYTSARDLATITRAALQNSAFREILTTRSHTMAATALRGELTLRNSYSILDPDSQYYYPYALGGKTGYASSAGQCFVCVAEKNGRTLISVVLNAGGTKTPKWTDTRALLDYAFSLS